MAAELVRLNPDVIISVNTTALLALQKTTTTIPIVMLATADPVAPAVVLALQETQAAAHALGLILHSVDVRAPGEIDLALSVIAREPPGALVLLLDSMIHSQRAPIYRICYQASAPDDLCLSRIR